MVPVTSRRVWLSGWMHRTWGTFAALPTIRRHRARSNAGIRRSRTASCWKTTTCLGDLEANIEKFVDHYNHRRYHESLSNLTPANVYFGRGPTILLERERIKRNTIQKRRLQHQKKAA